jgi:3'(2'), 5'-bisphosphate nucleotidase
VLSEEAPDVGFAERSRWEWLWLVDPLDGTREFIKRNDQFSVNIALIHRHEAVLGAGIATGERHLLLRLFGDAAYKQPAGQPPCQIQAARVCHYPVRVVSSLESYRTRRLQDYLGHLGPHRHLGMGGALKSCLVAEGESRSVPALRPDRRVGHGSGSGDRGASGWLHDRYAVTPATLQRPAGLG